MFYGMKRDHQNIRIKMIQNACNARPKIVLITCFHNFLTKIPRLTPCVHVWPECQIEPGILTNPSNTKSGTISLKNRDFCPKSGTFLKNLAKMAKNGNIRGKMLHTRNHKNRDMPYFIRRKRGTSRILAPKIGTVPPKSGRLESMELQP